MFATILGALPRPSSGGASAIDSAGSPLADDDAVRAVLIAQERAGLEPLTDGRLRWDGPLSPLLALDGVDDVAGRIAIGGAVAWRRALTVDEWVFAAGETSRAVKQSLPGPYSACRLAADADASRERATLAVAEALNAEIRALAAAGCPLVEIDEPDAVAIGDDAAERRLFADAHRRLTDGIGNVHLSLALTGGNADTAGAATFFDLPYASYAVDLIAGPDNWRLVTAAPEDRGIICGALGAAEEADEGPEVLVWAAHYAASSAARGLARVGLANAPGLDAIPWASTLRKLVRLGDAARIAAFESATELAEALDPRAVSSRSAALGRAVPPLRRARPGPAPRD